MKRQQGMWLNYGCYEAGGGCPALVITQVAACPPVPSYNQASCTLNLPPVPIAHRRRPFPTAGRVLVLPGGWQPVVDAFDSVVLDPLGSMCPVGMGYIRIPCDGYYWIEARASFEPAPSGTVLGVGVSCNGQIQQNAYRPAANPTIASISVESGVHLTQYYVAGDQIGVLAWSEQPGGTLSGSFDVFVEWKHA